MSKNIPEQETFEALSDDQKNVLKSLRASRIILPIIIGLGAVVFMVLRKFDIGQLEKIQWTQATLWWILAAIVLLVIRHLAFSWRMLLLSQGHFSFRKCIELIFIFEFSLCITPTTLGGSAVSLFVMTQERLSAARTATIVLYKVVLDTLFFIGTFPLLFLINGPKIIRPYMEGFQWDAMIFYLAYVGMITYGMFLFYGLFINPSLIRKALMGLVRIPFLRRFEAKITKLSHEVVLASNDMKHIGWRTHVAAFAMTWIAWAAKFLLISCLIYGIARPEMTLSGEILLYSRLQSMFIVMAFSPSPGGAGIAEGLFHPFLKDFIPSLEVAIVVALIWRLMSYYAYLITGVFVVINWVRKVFLKKPTL